MKILSFILSVILMTVSVCAVSPDDEVIIEDDPISSELNEILEGLPDVSTILPKPSADTADGGTDESIVPPLPVLSSDIGISPLDLTYGGAWSGSVLDYFSGVMRGHPFNDYVCFRMDQYTYVLYYGVDITFNNGYFVGSDLHLITYNTNRNNNDYVSFADNQTLSFSADGIFYSNVYSNAAQLEGVRTIEYIIVGCVLVCVLLFVSVIRMFMHVR